MSHHGTHSGLSWGQGLGEREEALRRNSTPAMPHVSQTLKPTEVWETEGDEHRTHRGLGFTLQLCP